MTPLVNKRTHEWKNWSGSVRFTPAEIERPHTEEELAELVRRAHEQGRTVRVVGSSHSANGIIESEDVLVTVEHLSGVLETDNGSNTALVGAGSKLEELGPKLLEDGLAMPNFGDVATQTVAGVIGTGTHGTGKDQKNLSSLLVGGRMVTAAGEVVEFSEKDDPDFLRAARLALGTMGVFTQVRVQLVPAYQVHRREYCTTTDACLAHLDELIEENRNFDFYWYPRDDQCKLRLLNPPSGGSQDIDYAAMVTDNTGWAYQIIPKHSHIPYHFDEMEYALPLEAGPECFQKVRRAIKQEWRSIAGWRILYRTVAADDTFLSTAHGRDTVTISLHQNSDLPFWDYFRAIEPIFRDYGGRPHWAKKHTLRADDLRPLYPEWNRFQEARAYWDPDGVFLNPYLRQLLGVEGDAR